MKSKTQKIRLHRETVRHLDETLMTVPGGATGLCTIEPTSRCTTTGRCTVTACGNC